jgi:hypothetical protein
MTKTELFRKMIREEVAKAIRAELPKILKEISVPESNSYVKESKSVPLTLNKKPPAPPKFSGNSPLASILNETAITMARTPNNSDWDTVGVDSGDVHMIGMRNPVSVGGVEDMLANSRNSMAVENVEVSLVPNFNNLMDSLISKGQI